MNKRQHFKAIKVILNQEPNKIIHDILDGSSKQFQNRHRIETHNFETLQKIRRVFGWAGWMQAILHIVCDGEFFLTKSNKIVKMPRIEWEQVKKLDRIKKQIEKELIYASANNLASKKMEND